MRDALIVDAVRSPIGRGKPGGALSGLQPVDLLAQTLQALVERTGIDPAVVDDVIVGAVGQAPAQLGRLGHGLEEDGQAGPGDGREVDGEPGRPRVFAVGTFGRGDRRLLRYVRSCRAVRERVEVKFVELKPVES